MPCYITRDIDGYYLTAIKIEGLPPDAGGVTIEKIEEEALDGTAYKIMGVKADPKPIYPEFFAASAGIALGIMSDLKNFQGTFVTITDGAGAVYTGLVCVNAQVLSKQRVVGARWYDVTYSGGYIVRAQMILHYVGTESG